MKDHLSQLHYLTNEETLLSKTISVVFKVTQPFRSRTRTRPRPPDSTDGTHNSRMAINLKQTDHSNQQQIHRRTSSYKL
jgi:hypothetical protein